MFKVRLKRRWLKLWGCVFFPTALILQIAILVPGSPTWGHQPEGEVYRAFQFSDSQVPSIDGDLSDWEIVGDSYTILTGQFYDLVNPEVEAGDSEDFSVRLMVGWNKASNRIYVAAQVPLPVVRVGSCEGMVLARRHRLSVSASLAV